MVNLPRERMDQVVKRFDDARSADVGRAGAGSLCAGWRSEYAEIQDMVGQGQGAARGRARAGRPRSDACRQGAPIAEMRALAEAELPAVEERIEALQKDIQILLLPKDAADEKNAILEIRAGTGGDEAALFAGDLFPHV